MNLRLVLTTPLLVAAIAMLSTSVAIAADGWATDSSKEHPAPSAENRIIRWCSTDGKQERFASANIDLTGYAPCGELSTPIYCDASGRRMIGGSNHPPVYKDCSVGPRIVVERTDGIEIDREALESEPPTTMGSEESRMLKKEVRAVANEQEKDPEIQVQRMLDGVIGNLLSVIPKQTDNKSSGLNNSRLNSSKLNGSKLPSSKLQRSKLGGGAMGGAMSGVMGLSEDQINQLIRYVDPQHQQQLEEILKNN